MRMLRLFIRRNVYDVEGHFNDIVGTSMCVNMCNYLKVPILMDLYW